MLKIRLNLRLSPEERVNFYNFISDRNLSRLRIVIPIAILYEFIILAYFVLKDSSYLSEADLSWLYNIIFVNSLSLLCMIIFSFLLYNISKKKIINLKSINFIYNFFFLAMILIGSITSAFDQNVTQSIAPFIIMGILVPILIVINPRNAIIYYIFSALLFLILLPYFNNQADDIGFISTNINIFTTILLGSTLNFIVWNNHLTNFRKNQLINKQNIELLNKNRELKTITKALNQEIITKDKFFSIIAHDLRSPLSGTIKSTQMISENFDVFSKEDIQEMITSINDSAKSVFQLLENLLQWAKIQNGTIVAHPDNFIAFQLFDANIKILEEFSNNKGIKISNNIDKDLTVNSDISLINIVIQNLLSNAIKFTNRNGKIVIDSYIKENDFIFSIQDNGIGMCEELRDNLFNQEYKSSRKGTEDESSSGLGLIICKEFIDLNHGKLWVDSQENIGSTFYFSLPRFI